MVDTLIGLIVLVIIVGIVVYLLSLLLDLIPMDGAFKKIAWVLILLVAALIVISRVLPMLGVSSPL
jgi:di/tricarboxylate transporter